MDRVADTDATHLTIAADDGDWHPFVEGVSIKVLREHQGTLSYLLRLAPGACLPPHRHPVDEECIVLEGRLRVGTRVDIGPGAYHLAHGGALHRDHQHPRPGPRSSCAAPSPMPRRCWTDEGERDCTSMSMRRQLLTRELQRSEGPEHAPQAIGRPDLPPGRPGLARTTAVSAALTTTSTACDGHEDDDRRAHGSGLRGTGRPGHRAGGARVAAGSEWIDGGRRPRRTARWPRLYDATFQPRVRAGAANRAKCGALAEEVVEDTYFQVWRQAVRFDPARGKALTWLLSMARSRAIDALASGASPRGHETLLTTTRSAEGAGETMRRRPTSCWTWPDTMSDLHQALTAARQRSRASWSPWPSSAASRTRRLPNRPGCRWAPSSRRSGARC
jgi:hypothetical protein